MSISIKTAPQNLTLKQKQTATQLYCAALTQKISPFLGTPDRAAKVLVQGFNCQRCVMAMDIEDQPIGIAGFYLDGEGLFEPPLSVFKQEYGWSGIVRALALSFLERKKSEDVLLMDGLAVAPCARGMGIGTKLLTAVEEVARLSAKSSVRLDVIDVNPRAKALYERRGFESVNTVDLGPARLLFDFNKITEMRKTLTAV